METQSEEKREREEWLPVYEPDLSGSVEDYEKRKDEMPSFELEPWILH